MKNSIQYRKVLRPILAIALAGICTLAAVAQPRPDNDRNRHRQPAPQQPVVSGRIQTPVGPHGYLEVRFGNDRLYTHRGIYYRNSPRGYVVVRPPLGLRVPVLPLGFARIYVNNAVFFRYNNIYYRPVPGGYIVVDTPMIVIKQPAPAVVTTSPPVVVATPTPAPVVAAANPNDLDYQSLWVNGAEYKFKDGQFFQKTADGLVWVEPLMGAVIAKLPADATSVWYQDIEYYDCDSVYFRKTPDGFKVVEAPWAKEG